MPNGQWSTAQGWKPQTQNSLKKKTTHTEVPEREDGIECENPSGTCLLSVEERKIRVVFLKQQKGTKQQRMKLDNGMMYGGRQIQSSQ